MSAAATIIGPLLSRAFAPRSVLTPSRWADEHAYFRDASGKVLKWTTPAMFREVMDSCADPSVREVTIKKAEQVGGTEAIQRVLQEVIDQRPRDLFYVYPNQAVAARQVRLKLMPALEATPRTAQRLRSAEDSGRARRNQSSMLLVFDRMSVMAAGSNSRANVEGFAAGLVVIDELDRCEEGTFERIQGRGAALSESLVIDAGTPEYAGHGIDARYELSDRRRFHVPCPHCGAYGLRRFDDVRWPGTRKDGVTSPRSRDMTAHPEQVEAGAAIACASCDRLIGHEHNLWQLERGVWVPDGCAVDSSGVVSGTPRVRTHRGYEITGLYRCFPAGVNPYGRIAAAFVEAGGNPSREFWNRRVGVAWSPKGEGVEVRVLREASERSRGWPYGMAAPWMVAAVASVDVQPNHAYVEVLGISAGDHPGGQRCGLLGWYEVPCPAGTGLGPVETVLARTYARLGGDESSPVRIVGAVMDSGHRPEEVYQWARLGGSRRACKGLAGGGGRNSMAQLVRWSKLEQDTRGRTIPGGLSLLLVNTWAWKQATIAQLQNANSPEKPGEAHDLGGTMPIELPFGVPHEWMVQVTSEQLVSIKQGGTVKTAWRMKVGRTANHALDCHVYALAYCHAMGAAGLRSNAANAGTKGFRKGGKLF